MSHANSSATTAAIPRWLRVILPAAIILLWLLGASIGGPYFGKVSEVSSNDQTAYLPDSADATRVQELASGFTDDDVLPAVVVFTSSTELDAQQLDTLQAAVADLSQLDAVPDDISPLMPSDDGLAAQAFVPISADAEVGDVVAELSERLEAAAPAGVTAYVTGPAGFTADLSAAFSGIDGVLLLVALLAVFVSLIVV